MSAIRAFTIGCWRGVKTRSSASLVIAAVVLVSAFTIFMSFPNEVLSRGINLFPGKRMSSDFNYAVISSVEAAALPEDRPVLYIAGGSSLRESIESAEALRDALRAGTGEPYEVADFMTKGQQMWLSEAYLTYALCQDKPRRRGIVIIAAHAPRFERRWDLGAGRLPDPRATMEGSSVRDRARYFGMVSLRAVADAIHFLVEGKGYDQQLGGRHRFVRGFERIEAMDNEEQKRRLEETRYARKVSRVEEKAKSLTKNYDKGFAETSEQFVQMIAKLRACADVDFVFHLTPMHPLFFESEAAEIITRHENNMAQLAERLGASVFISYRAAELTDYDFSDTIHLRNWSKILEVSGALADHLIAVAKEPDNG